ncbi:hypothetical protein DFJ77DRAFT_440904 [Powellomyces hirtus]|nr:hypothetical protein DFJ77DRAFT_440904 [Powellomyces hirtus]
MPLLLIRAIDVNEEVGKRLLPQTVNLFATLQRTVTLQCNEWYRELLGNHAPYPPGPPRPFRVKLKASCIMAGINLARWSFVHSLVQLELVETRRSRKDQRFARTVAARTRDDSLGCGFIIGLDISSATLTQGLSPKNLREWTATAPLLIRFDHDPGEGEGAGAPKRKSFMPYQGPASASQKVFWNLENLASRGSLAGSVMVLGGPGHEAWFAIRRRRFHYTLIFVDQNVLQGGRGGRMVRRPRLHRARARSFGGAERFAFHLAGGQGVAPHLVHVRKHVGLEMRGPFQPGRGDRGTGWVDMLGLGSP